MDLFEFPFFKCEDWFDRIEDLSIHLSVQCNCPFEILLCHLEIVDSHLASQAVG